MSLWQFSAFAKGWVDYNSSDKPADPVSDEDFDEIVVQQKMSALPLH